MNPFLVSATILFWVLFFVFGILTYLSNDESREDLTITSVFFFVIAVGLTISSGIQWDIRYGPDARPPAPPAPNVETMK